VQPAKSRSDTCDVSIISAKLHRWRSLDYSHVVVRDEPSGGRCYVLPVRSDTCPDTQYRDCAILINLREANDLQSAAMISAAAAACADTQYLDPNPL
jgi:hypothetical protein